MKTEPPTEAIKNLKVDKSDFDAILGKLIASPPKPATPKRKRVKKGTAKTSAA